jgi:hypothetical protein
MPEQKIRLVLAGPGSGKTYGMVDEIIAALDELASPSLPPFQGTSHLTLIGKVWELRLSTARCGRRQSLRAHRYRGLNRQMTLQVGQRDVIMKAFPRSSMPSCEHIAVSCRPSAGGSQLDRRLWQNHCCTCLRFRPEVFYDIWFACIPMGSSLLYLCAPMDLHSSGQQASAQRTFSK